MLAAELGFYMGSHSMYRSGMPLARSSRVLVEAVGDDTVIYDLDSKEAHCLNPFAAAVFSYADGRTTTAEIAELAGQRLGKPVTEAEVEDAVAQLDERTLLEDSLLRVDGDGLSRRSFVRKSALAGAAAAAAPLIASVAAPTPAAAVTPIPTGECCGDTTTGDRCTGENPNCESNHCCQNIGGTGHECNACKCVGDKNDCNVQQCGNPPGTCPPIVIEGVSTAACGQTSGGRCCYPDAAGACCPVVATGGGGVVTC
jgi:hypothetical protein